MELEKTLRRLKAHKGLDFTSKSRPLAFFSVVEETLSWRSAEAERKKD
jgi:hypothetical protein